ncbi:hypothetical protein Bbelb_325370 [Branchiostoma belcheri]|nr:hypothetical protein Bbelb_325370 [Branchiostoma belcheri]
MANVEQIFKKYDVNRDGHMSTAELEAALKELKVVPTKGLIEVLMKQYDVDGNGQLDLQEFTRLVGDLKHFGSADPQELLETFGKIDKDGSGFITPEELKTGLKHFFGDEPVTDEIVQWVIDGADKNADGRIDIAEFAQYIHILEK